MNTSPDSLTGVQQDIMRTAQIKAQELKSYVADVTRESGYNSPSQQPLSVRDITLFNSHIDAALQYLRGSFRPPPKDFAPVTGVKETERGNHEE